MLRTLWPGLKVGFAALALSIALADHFAFAAEAQSKTASVPAANIALQNVASAEFKPGALMLPLTVQERSGLARSKTVVSSGVPFPPGFLPDAAKLRVVDQNHKPVISQAVALNQWWKPAYDDSVQWALVSFLADVPANGTATYYLTDDGQASPPPSPLKLNRTADTISIETGVANFTVPLKGSALISKAAINGVEVIAGQGLRGLATTGDWPDQGLKLGTELTTAHEDVVVEESGPARIVLCIKGGFKPGDKNGKFYDYTARLYFAADSGAVRIIYTLSNGKLNPTLEGGKVRQHYVWPIKDASLVADLTLDKAAQVATLAEGKPVSDSQLLVYQDSAGGEKWQKLTPAPGTPPIAAFCKDKVIPGVTFRGYKVKAGEDSKELAAGDSHQGVIDAFDAHAGVALAIRNFRVEYPKALAGSASRIRAGLFPGEFGEPFSIDLGQRKSFDLRLTVHGAKPADLKGCFAEQDTLLLFRPDPAWMVRAAAAGAWTTGLAVIKDPLAGKRAARLDKDKLSGTCVGWDWFGWFGYSSGWNGGGGHWNENTCFSDWVIWGGGADFDTAESYTLWAGDLCSIHYDDPDMVAMWYYLRDGPLSDSRAKINAYPGHYCRDVWDNPYNKPEPTARPDSGHMAMYMFAEYYFLTGDARAREAVEHLGQRARADLWQYNHDDRSDGTGPTLGAIGWCKKQDPDKDPTFKLSSRYIGWPLFDLAQYYRITGRPELLDECRPIARAFRNTARYSPIGFMTLQIDPPGDTKTYGGQGPFGEYHHQSASQCFSHFQMAIMAAGLHEYYILSRDQEALDPLIGYADLLCHHCMLYDKNHKRIGWTYAYGDYWGPFTGEEAGVGLDLPWHGPTFTVFLYVPQELAWVYMFTGRRDFLDVIKDSVAALNGKPNLEVVGDYMVCEHPKKDDQAPAAISDLAAQPLGGGKVRLTWTAPGGDDQTGQAARYQVKWSTARIVELVTGWPDRTPPLPLNKAQWEAKAAAFNAQQRAFWSANTAPGAPVPAAAGSKESMELTGLPAGKVDLAIKTWNDADNMSPISNVVQVEVK